MDNSAIERAADTIWSLWQNGEVIPALPTDLRPTSRAEGYAVQAALARRSNDACVGWKIAATSTAGQRHIGVGGPLAGRILAARVHAGGATLSLARNRMRVAEPEFAFRFVRPLSPRANPYQVEEVLAAVGTLHLALELPDSRFAQFATVGEPSLIADNACAHELVLGDAVAADWRNVDLAKHEVLAHVGRRYDRRGIGSNVLGDPRLALTWLVNELSALAISLQPGQFVTTGTCASPLEIEPGEPIDADFGILGHITMTTSA
jgi:2-keto-4-pentenoate hydratase